MVKPDIILTHPTHQDYPLWRYYMRKYRSFFNNIFVVWHHAFAEWNYVREIQSYMKKEKVKFLHVPRISRGQDWRDVSVNLALPHCSASHVLFLEQDVIYHNEDFWTILLEKSYPVVGWKENSTTSRFHPSFLLVERKVIHQTSKYFGVKHGVYDHFTKISMDLEELVDIVYLKDIGLEIPTDWEHIRGCGYDYHKIQARGGPPLNRKNNFKYFNQLSLDVDIERHPHFVPVLQKGTTYVHDE